MKHTTLPCPVCHQATNIELTEDEEARYLEWYKGRGHIQQMFPDWDANKRELFLTGTHPKCWDEMFPSEDEDLDNEEREMESFLETEPPEDELPPDPLDAETQPTEEDMLTKCLHCGELHSTGVNFCSADCEHWYRTSLGI